MCINIENFENLGHRLWCCLIWARADTASALALKEFPDIQAVIALVEHLLTRRLTKPHRYGRADPLA